ncbi:hypothetical protein IJ380_03955 [Candidatus Saccharibacteria bacterium]|nr:hypothetical protein [Candidatus Saccharibacteria bacterium]
MKAYTTSKFANYVHTHMYLAFDVFSKMLTEKGLSDSFYKLNVDIDDNVAVWTFETDKEEVLDVFADVINEYEFTGPEVETAVKKVAEKNSWKAKIIDLDELIVELNNIKFQKEKPNSTNDSMESPSLVFEK